MRTAYRATGGSSPLTRGKLGSPPRRFSACRLIPAHAGKTLSQGFQRVPRRAHPRSRGENALSPPQGYPHTGSSPLTRGKPKLTAEDRQAARLIPAHAGKTGASPQPPPSSAAHPRSRGENLGLVIAIVGAPGSSPLTRGKPRPLRTPLAARRLIPAHAGKTGLAVLVQHEERAHPRSRGENRTRSAPATPTSGSSPLTRGKRGGEVGLPIGARLIPAHAGKTRVQGDRALHGGAHPRSRGENHGIDPARD